MSANDSDDGWVTHLLAPIIAWDDWADDDDRFAELTGPIELIEYQQLVSADIISSFAEHEKATQDHIVKSLESALCDAEFDFERALDSHLAPFDVSSDPKDLFSWILEDIKAIVEK